MARPDLECALARSGGEEADALRLLRELRLALVRQLLDALELVEADALAGREVTEAVLALRKVRPVDARVALLGADRAEPHREAVPEDDTLVGVRGSGRRRDVGHLAHVEKIADPLVELLLDEGGGVGLVRDVRVRRDHDATIPLVDLRVDDDLLVEE